MDKIHKDYKQLQRFRAKRAKKKAKRFKHYRWAKNLKLLGKAKNFRTEEVTRSQYWDYKKITVPSDFTFIVKPADVIAFIRKLKDCFDKKQKVYINMTYVKLIDYSAIVVLLSTMIRFKSQRIKFNGNFPNDLVAAKIFKDSGFFQTLNKDFLKDSDEYVLGQSNKIHTHAMKNVDSELGLKIMSDISPKILGHRALYKGLNRVLLELMLNSFNHAVPKKEGEKHWWLSVNVNERANLASFSFIDYGVGIFESLNNKPTDSKWFNWKRFLSLLTESNADLLKKILDGVLHQTVTGEHFRGKGLPGIKEAMDRKLISKLYVITNDVYADVQNNKYYTLPHKFEGTFVYWEIDKQTVSHPWN